MERKASPTVIYLSHGGGPMPLLNEPSHLKMIEFMKALPRQIEKPDEILFISAHWEEAEASVIESARPDLLYDYYGFPEEAYDLDYRAPGHPELASEIRKILNEAGIPCGGTTSRGLDHGVFIPLMMMYPEGDIPVTQLSLIKGLDTRKHLDLGKALRPLLNRNILVVGSGFSFHNMNAFRWGHSLEEDPRNGEFQDWLVDVCLTSYDKNESPGRLEEWERAPHSRYCHPREEHLLPLHVCYALAGGKAELAFDDYILGKRATAFLWK